jgi:hypothetical protein
MKFIAIIFAALVFSSTPFIQHPPDIACAIEKEYKRPDISPYKWAELTTGAPSNVLRAIAITESDERDDVPGDGGMSKGRFQIYEAYREWNIERYGEYDPEDPYQAAVLAGKKYLDNLSALGSEELAIAAHRQGATGVKNDGPSKWYVDRVYSNLAM